MPQISSRALRGCSVDKDPAMSALARLQEFTMKHLSSTRGVSKTCRQKISLLSAAALLGVSALASHSAQASDACRQLNAIESTSSMVGEHRDDFIRHYSRLCQEENDARIGRARLPPQSGAAKALPIQKIEEISKWLDQLRAAESRLIAALNREESLVLDEAREDFEELRVEFIQEIRLLGSFDLSHFRVESDRILSIPTDNPLIYQQIKREDVASRESAIEYRNTHTLSIAKHQSGASRNANLFLE